MTTTETHAPAVIVDHLGRELQVQLHRAEEEGKKDFLALQHLAGGAGRRIDADSDEAKALADRHPEVAQLLGGNTEAAAEPVDDAPPAPPAYQAPTE
jgi:hypothetical protein